MAVVTQGLGSIRILTGGYSEAFALGIAPYPPMRWQDEHNRYSLENIGAPYEEPVSLAEQKLHMRVDAGDNTDDDLIRSLIASARIQAENICRRVFVTSMWRFSMDHFPDQYGYLDVPYTFGAEMIPGAIRSVRAYERSPNEFSVPVSPVQAVTGFTYLDANGVRQSLTPDQYDVDLLGSPITIVPAYGTTWPTIRRGRYAVQITFRAGMGDADVVPANIKSWIKIQAATEYRNREGVALFRGTIQELGFFDRLLDPFRVFEF